MPTCSTVAEVCEDIGFPKGVINIGLAAHRARANIWSRHPGVDKISFTGNTQVDAAPQASSASNFKRCCRSELGGKSAAIVLEDADPSVVAPGLIQAGLINAGQAVRRPDPPADSEDRYDEYVDALAGLIGAMPSR